jgi:eukaryotic-like serine/threonine-protein kinase
MDVPRIDGFTIGEPIGDGGCGRVYRGVGDDGAEVAVKVFDAIAIDRSLLARSTQRLAEGGWPEGVMPVLAGGFDARPATRVTPLCGVVAGDEWAPATLQLRLDEHPGEQTWNLVRRIAAALAGMHDRRVVHANLKPGNVFFSATGEVLLTDWALGNIPGAARVEFTDALLYQPPEQLCDNGGYFDEQGYRWDVHAFGVLAFRLLTGRFPRCNETFERVTPLPGTTRREGIAANLPKVAKAITNDRFSGWPDAPANRLEELLRELVERCIELDPFRRPASMVVVQRLIERADELVEVEAERELLLDRSRRADKRAWRANVVAGVALGAAVVCGAMLVTTRAQLRRERIVHESQAGGMRLRTGQAEATAAAAAAAAQDARQTLAWERDRWLARLHASRETGDRLFEWAMAAGARRLPALEGRESRLRGIEAYFLEFLARTRDDEGLAAERARVMLQLAEVSLALGEAETAATRLDEALAAGRVLETGPAWQLRVATDRVVYALLRQQLGGDQLAGDIAAARRALEELPLADLDAARVRHLHAELDLAEALDFARRGDDGVALERLMRATVALNDLADQRPDAAVIRSRLASCYLSSAGILEGMAKFGDAREARTLASEELKRLLDGDPDNPALRSELAGTFGAMAEAAVIAGDVAAAVRLSNEATAMLEELRREQPERAEVAVRLAAQYGLMAGLHVDRGQTADAMKLIDGGINMLENGPAASSAPARYRLALLWWQKARLLGVAGDAAQEVALERRALEALQRLEGDPVEGLRTEQIRRSTAYLLGDLAHATELAGDRAGAVKHFEASVEAWELLCRAKPGQEEYDEGLAWSRERLKEINGE